MGVIFNLVDQVPEQFLDNFRLVGWKAPHVMVEASDIETVSTTEITHRQPSIFTGQVGMVVDPLFQCRPEPLDQRNRSWFGYNQFLTHMTDGLIEEQDNWCSVRFSDIEGLHGHPENILVV